MRRACSRRRCGCPRRRPRPSCSRWWTGSTPIRRIHGFMVQLPLPKHIDSEQVLNADLSAQGRRRISPGERRQGVGRRPDRLPPATPYGVQQMLIRSGIETKGAHAVIVGRSNIVGKPMASLLIQEGPGGNATVTICHSRSRDLPGICRRPTSWSWRSASRSSSPRTWCARGRRDRHRDQPGRRPFAAQGLPDRGRRGLRAGGGGRVGDHAGAGRGGKMTIAMLLLNTLQASQHGGVAADVAANDPRPAPSLQPLSELVAGARRRR